MVRWDAVATGGACLSVSLGFFACLYIEAVIFSQPPPYVCVPSLSQGRKDEAVVQEAGNVSNIVSNKVFLSREEPHCLLVSHPRLRAGRRHAKSPAEAKNQASGSCANGASLLTLSLNR